LQVELLDLLGGLELHNVKLSEVLIKYYSHEKWILVEEDYEGLDWQSNNPKPTLEELENLKEELIKEEQAKIDAKASAMAKLAALGLSEQEVAALIQ
jgi:predicted ABC-type transport system involved in lysophospholipase L1 biosynthesis ATPase subunit